ncbi:hypothetical protein VTI74DRAFT_6939 [Chaetomium olivicolor]
MFMSSFLLRPWEQDLLDTVAPSGSSPAHAGPNESQASSKLSVPTNTALLSQPCLRASWTTERQASAQDVLPVPVLISATPYFHRRILAVPEKTPRALGDCALFTNRMEAHEVKEMRLAHQIYA